LDESESKQTFILLLNNLLPSGLRGVVLAALLAALISSIIAVMNSVSTLTVRDFILEFRPETSERVQVLTGRVVIILATVLGLAATWMIYKSEEGLYKYLQTITAYLVFPVFPAIIFGIMSKKVTLKGAYISVIAGVILATIFVTDQLVGPEAGQKLFPFLHHKLTLNFGYRGLWGTIVIIIVLFAVSGFTPKTDKDKLVKTTINWQKRMQPIKNLSDWRLQWIILAIATILVYYWLW
jgi:SSS family solute:Na+ symporter